jgi:hypothetical protein
MPVNVIRKALMSEKEHKEIWLQPWCGECQLKSWESDGGRQWCEDNPWDDCEECGAKPIKYVLDVSAKRTRS